MTARALLVAAALSIAAPVFASALQPPPPAKPPAAAKPPAGTPDAAVPPGPPAVPRHPGQPVNVKVDVTITDQRGESAPVRKTVSVVVADDMAGYIRTEARAMGIGSVPLNVDAAPTILPDGKINLRLNLQYDLPAPKEALADPKTGTISATSIHESLSVILASGQSLLAAQSSDPIGDRQVTVEVKATVMR